MRCEGCHKKIDFNYAGYCSKCRPIKENIQLARQAKKTAYSFILLTTLIIFLGFSFFYFFSTPR